jgi:hypothetical protein
VTAAREKVMGRRSSQEASHPGNPAGAPFQAFGRPDIRRDGGRLPGAADGGHRHARPCLSEREASARSQ